MSLINRINIFIFGIFIFSTTFASAEELKKIGKFKDWETLVLNKDNELTCFAQTKPVLQSPKANKRSGVKLSGPLKNFEIPIFSNGSNNSIAFV